MDPQPTQTAEPSPAPATPKVEVPRDPQAYAEWRTSGKLPEAKPAKPAEPKPEASAASKDSDTAPPAESGDPNKQEPKPKARPNAETRLNELLDDLKRAGLSPAELKTFKREVQKSDQPSADQPKPEPAKAPEPPKRPKLEEFDSYEKYEEAREKYFEAVADYRAGIKVAEADAKRADAESRRAAKEKLDAATSRYGDAAASTITDAAAKISNDAQIPNAVKAIVNDSPVLADLLYVMGSKPDDLAEFVSLAKTNPGAAIRKAVLLERLIADELAKPAKEAGETARGEDGKFASEKTPVKKTTQAPPPPSEVSGRNAAPPDAIERAITAKDFASYRAAANARDLARRQGR